MVIRVYWRRGEFVFLADESYAPPIRLMTKFEVAEARYGDLYRVKADELLVRYGREHNFLFRADPRFIYYESTPDTVFGIRFDDGRIGGTRETTDFLYVVTEPRSDQDYFTVRATLRYYILNFARMYRIYATQWRPLVDFGGQNV